MEERLTETIYKRATELMEADLGDELVALDVKTGDFFDLNSVAADVWRLLEHPQSAEQLCASLLSEYEVDAEQCHADIIELLNTMVAEGLVEVGINSESGPK